MSNRVRVRFGDIEVEYEGAETYSLDDLLRLVNVISSMKPGTTKPSELPQADQSEKRYVGTTTDIAAKLNAKTGRDLVLAAAFRLNVIQGQEGFGRSDLIHEMRSATPYFKQTYVNNLSKTLNRMLKAGELNEPSRDRYCLSAKKRAELQKALAD